MRPAFLGIIGCGAMGRLIARHIREQLPSYRLGGLFSRTTAHAEGLALELGDVPVLGLQQLIETCDLLVEATSAAAMPDIVRACLAAGKAVVPLSVGGFSLDPALLRDVEAARAAVHVPSGAIAGLDGIRASSSGNMSSRPVFWKDWLEPLDFPLLMPRLLFFTVPLPSISEKYFNVFGSWVPRNIMLLQFPTIVFHSSLYMDSIWLMSCRITVAEILYFRMVDNLLGNCGTSPNSDR